jgi:hypothetical protein
MSHALDPRTGQRLVLQPGHLRAVYVPEGTQLHLQCGRVELSEPPRWLADRMVCLQRPLLAGQTHRIGLRGWLSLVAPLEGPAVHVLLVLPQPVALRAWQQLCRASRPVRAWLRALRSASVAPSPRP